MCHETDVLLAYLPSYLPDFNPKFFFKSLAQDFCMRPYLESSRSVERGSCIEYRVFVGIIPQSINTNETIIIPPTGAQFL